MFNIQHTFQRPIFFFFVTTWHISVPAPGSNRRVMAQNLVVPVDSFRDGLTVRNLPSTRSFWAIATEVPVERATPTSSLICLWLFEGSEDCMIHLPDVYSVRSHHKCPRGDWFPGRKGTRIAYRRFCALHGRQTWCMGGWKRTVSTRPRNITHDRGVKFVRNSHAPPRSRRFSREETC